VVNRGPRTPRISDAAGWEETYGSDYEHVTIEAPTGLTVGNTEEKWRFSNVPEAVVLRNWFRLVAPGHRTRYFYGETAQSDVRREARDLDWEIEREAHNW
jgi:hypothetical protein